MAHAQIHGKPDIQGRFGSLSYQFPVAETGVSIAQQEIGPAFEDRQVHHRALVHPVVVQVPAMTSHRARRNRLLQGWGNANATDRRMCRKLELHLVAQRLRGPHHPIGRFENPFQRIPPFGAYREDPLSLFYEKRLT